MACVRMRETSRSGLSGPVGEVLCLNKVSWKKKSSFRLLL
jgi:hypothetical protein